MSLLVAWATPDRAVLAVDTWGKDGLEPSLGIPMSKVQIIPHAHCALAVRGFNAYGVGLSWILQSPRPFEDFDQLLDLLQPTLEVLRMRVIENMPAGLDARDASAQLAIVGWSRRQQRMLAKRCEITTHGHGQFEVRDIEHVLVAPWEDEMGEPPDPSQPGGLEALARIQVEWLRRKHGPNDGGGELLTVTLTQRDMLVRRECSFD